MIDHTPDPAPLAELRAARLAALAAELVGEGLSDLLYEPLREEPLGAGLSRQLGMYVYRERAEAPVEYLGDVEGYALELGAGRRIALEIDAGLAREVRRRVHLIWPGRNVIDVSFRAVELAQLGQLLARPEVAEALARWAAEEAAGDAAQAGQKGGQQ